MTTANHELVERGGQIAVDYATVLRREVPGFDPLSFAFLVAHVSSPAWHAHLVAFGARVEGDYAIGWPPRAEVPNVAKVPATVMAILVSVADGQQVIGVSLGGERGGAAS